MRARRGRLAEVVAAAPVGAVLSAAWAGPAAADAPVRAFSAVVAGPGVAVSGTYTPLVGNIVGDGNDDIFWYAPGSTPDYLYAADTPDGYYQQGTVSAVQSIDYWPGVRPFSGDFDGDDSLDVFFDRPGAGADAIGYGGFLASPPRSPRSCRASPRDRGGASVQNGQARGMTTRAITSHAASSGSPRRQ